MLYRIAGVLGRSQLDQVVDILAQGRFVDGQWSLLDVERSMIRQDGVVTERIAELTIPALVDPALFDVTAGRSLLFDPRSAAPVSRTQWLETSG